MLYLFYSIVILATTVIAAEINCEQEWSKIERIYAESYACDYMDGNCYNNALLLAKKLLSVPNIEKDKLYVAYIFPREKVARTIYAREGRSGSQEWKYHVFVIYKGQVMDHDHGKVASIKSVTDYVEDMFEKEIPEVDMIEGQHLFEVRSDALLRLIPAKDYVENTIRTHSGTLDYQQYIKDPEGKYPAMQIKDLLQKFQNQTK